MSERLDRAVIEALRDPTRIRQADRHFVHDLLTLVRERCRQAGEHRLDLLGRQSDFLAAPFMRSGRVGGMPFAIDDDDRDLALALAERIAAGVEMGAERRRRLYQLWVVHPDLAWTAGRAADLHQKAITLLLLRGHLVIGDLGVAAEGGRLGHLGVPSRGGLRAHPATAATALSTRSAPNLPS